MLYCRILNGKTEKTECSPEFELSCELLVAGLGTAGAMAAISGAESGLDTVGVEVFGSMGGIGTVGGIWDYSWGNPGGRFEELDLRAQKLCDSVFMHTGTEDSEIGSRFIHGAAKAYVLEDTARKAGCRLLLNTSVTGVFVEDGRIVGVECFDASGRFNIAAKVVIDSTGDQIVVRSAGFPTRTESDAARMYFTRTRAVIAGRLVRNSPVCCGQRTSALRDDFRLSEILVDVGSKPPFLCESYSANGRMVEVAEMPCFRDAERIFGIETLELIPYLRGEFTGEPLFFAFAPIDHVGGDIVSASYGQKLWWLGCKMRGFGLNVPVTAGMMIPEGSQNLIVADRGISLGDELIGCVRMKKDMERLGEAAAAIAYFAVRDKLPVYEVESHAVAARLLESGFRGDSEPVISAIQGFMEWTPVKPLTTNEELGELLASGNYGAAVVFALGGEFSPDSEVESMLGVEKTRFGAAALLGILGIFGRKPPCEVTAILREAAAKPLTDRTLSADKLPQTAAIWILGELCDRDSLGLLRTLETKYANYPDESVEKTVSRLCLAAAESIMGETQKTLRAGV